MGSLETASDSNMQVQDDSGYVQDDSSPSKSDADEEPRIDLLDLSDDVLLWILQYCEARDLKALSYSCRRLSVLVQDRTLWRRVVSRSHPCGPTRLRWYLSLTHAQTDLITLAGHAQPERIEGQAEPCMSCLARMAMSFSPATPPSPASSEDSPSALASGSNSATYSSSAYESAIASLTVPASALASAPADGLDDEFPIPDSISCLMKFNESLGFVVPADAPDAPIFTVTPSLLRLLHPRCPQLHTLELIYCNLDWSRTNLSHLPTGLKRLSLRGCRSHRLPDNRSCMSRIHHDLPHLEDLDLSSFDGVEGVTLLPLSKLVSLRRLYMRNCTRLHEFVAYASLSARYGFRALKVLDVRGSTFSDSEMSAFGWLPQLEELYISSDYHEEPHIIPPELAAMELEPWEHEVPASMRCPSPPPESPPPPEHTFSPSRMFSVGIPRRPEGPAALPAPAAPAAPAPAPPDARDGVHMNIRGQDVIFFVGGDPAGQGAGGWPDAEDNVIIVVGGRDDNADDDEDDNIGELFVPLAPHLPPAPLEPPPPPPPAPFNELNDDDDYDEDDGDVGEPSAPLAPYLPPPLPPPPAPRFDDGEDDDYDDAGEPFVPLPPYLPPAPLPPYLPPAPLPPYLPPAPLPPYLPPAPLPPYLPPAPLQPPAPLPLLPPPAPLSDDDDNYDEDYAEPFMPHLPPAPYLQPAPLAPYLPPSPPAPPSDDDEEEDDDNDDDDEEEFEYDLYNIEGPHAKRQRMHDEPGPSAGPSRRYVKFRRNQPPVVVDEDAPPARPHHQREDEEEEEEEEEEEPRRQYIPQHVVHMDHQNHRFFIQIENERAGEGQAPRQVPGQARGDHRGPIVRAAQRIPGALLGVRPRHQPVEPDMLITDATLKKFGHSEHEDEHIIRIEHAGAGGPVAANTDRPDKSKLKRLVCTNYALVTNRSLAHLATAAPDLVFVDVRGTLVETSGVMAFKALRPDCEVLFDTSNQRQKARLVSAGNNTAF